MGLFYMLDGVPTSVAFKGVCRVATTANITLSGLQTIDGVTVSAYDRVLVKDQTTGANNGIYLAASGAWRRAADWDTTGDVVQGTAAYVTQGSTNTGIWVVTTVGTITIGTTAVTFEGGLFIKSVDTSDDITEGSVNLFRNTPELVDYGAVGDGTTDDETAVDAFITAVASGEGTVAAGTYKATSIAPAAGMTIRGAGRYLTEFKRDSDGANFFSVTEDDGVSLSDLSFDNNFSTNADIGHVVRFEDCDQVDLRYIRARNYGRVTSGGGTGVIAFATSFAPISHISFDHIVTVADDSTSDNTNGIVIADARYSFITNSFAEAAIAFGLEFKNDTRYSVMANSIATDCNIGFGYGQDTVADDGCDFNVATGLVSYANDFGMVMGEADYNVWSALVVDSTNAPNRVGDGNVAGIRIYDLSDGNLVSSLLTYGANMDYPVRIGGDRNYVSFASHDTVSGNVVTFDAGAVKNFVEFLHPGTRTSILTLLTDNSGVDADSTNANVVHSPATGEYLGTLSDHFHWRTMSSGATAPTSDHRFWFETDGMNLLALMSPGTANDRSGLSIHINGTANVGEFSYVKGTPGSNDYWRVRVNGTQQLRLYDGILRPETDDDITLGSSSVGFADLFLAAGGEIRLNNVQLLDTVGGLSTQSATAAAIAAVGNAINTANKRAGKMVWDTTNTRLMVATGSAAADAWKVADGATTVTPA